MHRSLVALCLLSACATPVVSTDKNVIEGDDTDVVDTDTPIDVVDTDVDTTDTDAGVTDTDVGPAPQIVRFVALGDAGEGNTEQYTVAQAIADVCAVRGCEFALYLGDNFYDDGVHSTDDPQFQDKFELPYADLDFPFHVVLGNHDFGEIPLQFWRTDYQVDYTLFSSKWSMPDHFYEFTEAHAGFIALDTNMIMLGLDWTQAQRPWVNAVMNGFANKTWRIAFGHHPWKSNGPHGNAGNYEGAWFDPTGIVNGTNVKEFLRGTFCNKLDIYISGHDHSRQWLDPTCGVHIFVAGAGAKNTDFEHRDDNDTVWEDDTTPGFMWVELRDGTATIAHYDMHGNMQHEGVIVK